MPTIFRKAEVWEVVNGTTELDPESAEYKNKAQVAHTIILSSIEPSQIRHVRNAKGDGVEAWKALENLYQRKSCANRIFLKRQLYRFKHDTSQPIDVYIRGIRRLAWQLQRIDAALSDADIIDILIMNLDASWDDTSMVLTHTIADNGSLMDVERVLLAVGERKSLMERKPGLTTSNTRHNSKTRKCYSCGRSGHIAKDCHEKGNGQTGMTGHLIPNDEPSDSEPIAESWFFYP